jgi:5'-methylthioadenosine phosphorylase
MKIGVIGGSGLYDLGGSGSPEWIDVETPFGAPSDAYCRVELGGREVYFLPRHGRGHTILPTEINHRANVFGMKKLGVECVISVSAVGSLREDLRPRDILLPDQYFDRTKQSLTHTFFGNGLVAHVGFGDPTCDELRNALGDAIERVLAAEDPSLDLRVQRTGTYVNMEGPAFSTRAESNFYRHFGFDVIGMTSLPEAKLCREAEICYQALAMVTDYDCWHEDEADVTAESVGAHLAANSAMAKKVLQEVIPAIPTERACACGNALASAIMSSRTIPDAVQDRLGVLIEKYI